MCCGKLEHDSSLFVGKCDAVVTFGRLARRSGVPVGGLEDDACVLRLHAEEAIVYWNDLNLDQFPTTGARLLVLHANLLLVGTSSAREYTLCM